MCLLLIYYIFLAEICLFTKKLFNVSNTFHHADIFAHELHSFVRGFVQEYLKYPRKFPYLED